MHHILTSTEYAILMQTISQFAPDDDFDANQLMRALPNQTKQDKYFKAHILKWLIDVENQFSIQTDGDVINFCDDWDKEPYSNENIKAMFEDVNHYLF